MISIRPILFKFNIINFIDQKLKYKINGIAHLIVLDIILFLPSLVSELSVAACLPMAWSLIRDDVACNASPLHLLFQISSPETLRPYTLPEYPLVCIRDRAIGRPLRLTLIQEKKHNVVIFPRGRLWRDSDALGE